MAGTMIRRLTARDARLSSFRFYDLLVHVFVVILLISNLVGQKICAIPLFTFHGQPVIANVSGAQLLFPITYIFGDIFTEILWLRRTGSSEEKFVSVRLRKSTSYRLRFPGT